MRFRTASHTLMSAKTSMDSGMSLRLKSMILLSQSMLDWRLKKSMGAWMKRS